MMLQCGIIGCGRVAPNHYSGFASTGATAVKWACDRDAAAARDFAAQFDIPRVTADAQEVFDDPAVSIVSIATDHRQHFPLALAAIRAGKHVLIEKPLVLEIEHAETLIAEARRRGVLVAGISQHRFDPQVGQVKRVIDAGALGKLLLVNARLLSGRAADYFAESYWRGLRLHEGGSALINQAYHVIDIVLWLAGPACKVQAFADRLVHGEVVETEDTLAAILQFKNGAVGNLSVTTGYLGTAWDSCVEVVGSAGRIVFDINFPHAIHRWEVPGAAFKPLTGAEINAAAPGMSYYGASHQAQIQDFVQAVQGRRALRFGPETALDTVRVILDIYESACANGFAWGHVERAAGPLNPATTAR
ncbi:MAG: Gfo/Idh/MocA family oxidoreductase [Anaerolineae bacterium]|nr:Gfo/Idh/MocA family oxidoreductase [Anaerolineae bacterium]